MRIFITSLILLLSAAASPARAQIGEINLLTDLNMPFPAGCLSIGLPDQPRSDDSVLVDEDVAVPSVNSDQRDGRLNVLIWRVACADENYSVVLVRLTDLLDDLNDPAIVSPQIFIKRGAVDRPFSDDPDQYLGRLQSLPTGGDFGAEGNIVGINGQTWILAVEIEALGANQAAFFPEDYNDAFTIEMTWENYSLADTRTFRFQIDQFRPTVDPPQFNQTLLNGRYSGQWVDQDAQRQGLVLQIGEQLDENFVFAIFFTYLDGDAVWIVGNTEPEPMQPGPVTIDMALLDDGAFITSNNQPPADQIDVEGVGQIIIEAVDCNTIRMNYDFSPINQGTGTLTLERFIRIAGYDCNVWE
ncbi:MAG: hypothetical protein AAF446_02395 [Pseudomonadota bacterium]